MEQKLRSTIQLYDHAYSAMLTMWAYGVWRLGLDCEVEFVA